MSQRATEFIVAGSLHQAILTATVDLNWQRIGQALFERPTGEIVQYVGSIRSLVGRERGTVVWVGYGYSNNKLELADFEDFERSGRIIARSYDQEV